MNYETPELLDWKRRVFLPTHTDIMAVSASLDRFNRKHLDLVHNQARQNMRDAQDDHQRSRQKGSRAR